MGSGVAKSFANWRVGMETPLAEKCPMDQKRTHVRIRESYILVYIYLHRPDDIDGLFHFARIKDGGPGPGAESLFGFLGGSDQMFGGVHNGTVPFKIRCG